MNSRSASNVESSPVGGGRELDRGQSNKECVMVAAFFSIFLYVGILLVLVLGGLVLVRWILGRLDAERWCRDRKELEERHRQDLQQQEREEQLQQQASLAVVNAVNE